MINWHDIQARAGTKELVSYAGGRSRYLSWSLPLTPDEARHNGEPIGAILGTLHGATVIVATPDRIQLSTEGFNTATTVEAFNSLCGSYAFHNVAGELKYRGEAWRDGSWLDYSGNITRRGMLLAPVRDAAAYWIERTGRLEVYTTGRARRGVADTLARRYPGNLQIIPKLSAPGAYVYGPRP